MTSADPHAPAWLQTNGDAMQGVHEFVARMSELTGRGEAADGLIQAQVNNSGALTALTIDPQATRVSSTELSEQVLAAAKAASEDLNARIQELVRLTYGDETLDADPLDTANQVVDQLAGLQAGLARSMDDILAEVERIQRAAEPA